MISRKGVFKRSCPGALNQDRDDECWAASGDLAVPQAEPGSDAAAQKADSPPVIAAPSPRLSPGGKGRRAEPAQADRRGRNPPAVLLTHGQRGRVTCQPRTPGFPGLNEVTDEVKTQGNINLREKAI